jgi:UDP-N-acetylglucosamine--N-acetylmuramyl-(pentapeptide) pyrophosphoryl-undecaprenol N-acetylglucosamine transferase
MQPQQPDIKVIISGGGTGGHVFPAIAIAHALKKANDSAEILFVGAKGRMEMEKVPAAGYRIIGLDIMGLQRSLSLKNLKFPFKLFSSLRRAAKIIREFKPDVVVGVGGYASGPVLKKATSRNIPTVIQEQNSYPGITNKLLAAKASVICVAYDGLEKFFPKEKIVFTGNPVRQDLTDLENKRTPALQEFGFDASAPVILVIGGSLGARTLNESIEKNLPAIAEQRVQLLWQTGKAFFEQARQAASSCPHAHVRVYDFITRMDLAYAVADIVVSRAGALSVSELCIAKKPAILVPSPNVSEDHQTHNAMTLVKRRAAFIVKDSEARDKLAETMLALVKSPEQQKTLADNISELGKPDAADRIANIILDLAQKGRP